MKCTIEGITIEGTPAEVADFLKLRRSETAEVPQINRRRGKAVIIRFGEGNEQLCRSIVEARDYLCAQGVRTTDTTIKKHIDETGAFTIGRYTVVLAEATA